MFMDNMEPEPVPQPGPKSRTVNLFLATLLAVNFAPDFSRAAYRGEVQGLQASGDRSLSSEITLEGCHDARPDQEAFFSRIGAEAVAATQDQC